MAVALCHADFPRFRQSTGKKTCQGQTPELRQICRPDHELNHQLRGRVTNSNVADGLCAQRHYK